MWTLLFAGNKDILEGLPRQAIEADGFRALLAGTGREAFDVTATEAPALVVLFVERAIDIHAALVSVLAEERGIPIVICTTTCECPDDLRLWPADALLVAPGELGELMAAVEEVLRRRERGLLLPLASERGAECRRELPEQAGFLEPDMRLPVPDPRHAFE